jgi:peptidyl-prolyl cis-trans isomerase A (cyclophilin A)
MRRNVMLAIPLALVLLAPLARAQDPKKALTEDTKKSTVESATKPAAEAPKKSPLFEPGSPLMNQVAPPVFKVKFQTTKGDFVMTVHRDWAPKGADHFYNLVKAGYYNDLRFFRVIDGFMVQFGISGDPKLNETWRAAKIQDDPVKQKNLRGFVSYAMAGANTRTTQLFINFANNSASLDAGGFSPFAEVTTGMDVVDEIYSGYGEGAPRGAGPEQGRIQAEGNAYLDKEFPKLDKIIKASVTD